MLQTIMSVPAPQCDLFAELHEALELQSTDAWSCAAMRALLDAHADALCRTLSIYGPPTPQAKTALKTKKLHPDWVRSPRLF
jgi:hypothetical protein